MYITYLSLCRAPITFPRIGKTGWRIREHTHKVRRLNSTNAEVNGLSRQPNILVVYQNRNKGSLYKLLISYQCTTFAFLIASAGFFAQAITGDDWAPTDEHIKDKNSTTSPNMLTISLYSGAVISGAIGARLLRTCMMIPRRFIQDITLCDGSLVRLKTFSRSHKNVTAPVHELVADRSWEPPGRSIILHSTNKGQFYICAKGQCKEDVFNSLFTRSPNEDVPSENKSLDPP